MSPELVGWIIVGFFALYVAAHLMCVCFRSNRQPKYPRLLDDGNFHYAVQTGRNTFIVLHKHVYGFGHEHRLHRAELTDNYWTNDLIVANQMVERYIQMRK